MDRFILTEKKEKITSQVSFSDQNYYLSKNGKKKKNQTKKQSTNAYFLLISIYDKKMQETFRVLQLN